MRKQQQVWQHEHTSQNMLPALAETKPSSGVVKFIEYLKQKNVSMDGRSIDIGCGRGRNSLYLVQQGMSVEAVDYIEDALEVAKQLVAQHGQAEAAHFIPGLIDSKWPYEDETFDIAVDCFSSIDIETREGRETCRNEILRTLKPGGYALVTVVSADDEWERDRSVTKPGPEPNSVIWLENEKFQKNYDEAELREFYKSFEIVELQKISKLAFKLGKQGMATNFWMVLRKPASL